MSMPPAQSGASSARGTILLAHGSRDPLWKQPIEAVACHIGAMAPQVAVRCAYLEATTPDLLSSAAELVELGITLITVVPLFLGLGKHAREDLPLLIATLQSSHPNVTFDLRPALGEEPEIIALIARLAIS